MCGYLPYLKHLRPSHNMGVTQRGAVLIMVLLIVALVAGLGIKFASQYQLGLARAESRWHGMQARAFLEGTEELAKILFPTADIDPTSDYIGEPWSNEVPIEEDGVSGVAQLVDATSKLNLNDLDTSTPFNPDLPIGTATRYTESQRRFIRLLQTFPDLQINQQDAEYLLEAVVDWIDRDDAEAGQGGAEGNYYQGQPDPYLPANGLFQSVEELRLVRGFAERPEIVLSLLPFITVLPSNQAGININTIPLGGEGESVSNLVRSLNTEASLEPISELDAQQFLSNRPETGFSDSQAIMDAWSKQFSEGLDPSYLNTSTQFFWLEASVQLVDQRRSMRSLMQVIEIDSIRNLKVIQRADVFELPSQVRKKKENEEGFLAD